MIDLLIGRLIKLILLFENLILKAYCWCTGYENTEDQIDDHAGNKIKIKKDHFSILFFEYLSLNNKLSSFKKKKRNGIWVSMSALFRFGSPTFH